MCVVAACSLSLSLSPPLSLLLLHILFQLFQLVLFTSLIVDCGETSGNKIMFVSEIC